MNYLTQAEIEEETLLTAVRATLAIWDLMNTSYTDINGKSRHGKKSVRKYMTIKIYFTHFNLETQFDKLLTILLSNTHFSFIINLAKDVQTEWRSPKDCYQRDLQTL